VDIVCQFIQERPVTAEELPRFGGLRLRAGTTVVFSQSGKARFVIPKPLKEEAETRNGVPLRSLKGIEEFIQKVDGADESLLWRDSSYMERRMVERANFALLDRGLDRRVPTASEPATEVKT
jgi:hypothetical protein